MHHVATLLDPRLKNGILSAQEKTDAMLVVRTMMSEVEEHATVTDSENATSEPPAKKMKVEQSSSKNDFLADLFCMSTTAAVQDELDSCLTSTDSGSDLLNYWRGKDDVYGPR